MTDDAEVTMALYMDLLSEEERVLKGIENDILRVLFQNAISARPIWTSRTDPNNRFVRLYLPASPQPRVLLELPSSELATLSPDELLSRLEGNLR
jgi:hypothetical protein